MFAGTLAKTRAKETDQITGDRTQTRVSVRSPGGFRDDDAPPVKKQIRDMPASIAKSGPRPPHRGGAKFQSRKRRKDGSATLKKPPGHKRQEQVQQSQVGSHRNGTHELAQ
jgi:hypothetical protein